MAGLCNALEEVFPSEKLTSKFDRKFYVIYLYLNILILKLLDL